MMTHTFQYLFLFVISHKACAEKMKRISTEDLIQGNTSKWRLLKWFMYPKIKVCVLSRYVCMSDSQTLSGINGVTMFYQLPGRVDRAFTS